MPDKPLWLDRLPEALRQLENGTEPWIDRPALESLLGVGRRRAQQLLAPLGTRRVGARLVVPIRRRIRQLRHRPLQHFGNDLLLLQLVIFCFPPKQPGQ